MQLCTVQHRDVLQAAVISRCPGLLIRDMLLIRDNVRPHTPPPIWDYL